METESRRRRQAVLRAARELGFELAGIADATPRPELRYFPSWIESGRGGTMRYLARPAEGGEARYAREDVRAVFPWARSVVCCGLLYNSGAPKSIDCRARERGWISRYAWGDDYHEIVLAKMRTLAQRVGTAAGSEPRVYVDTGPIVERVYARHAGLGWIGKNTCLIHEQLGSWFFIGTLVSSVEIEPDEPRAGPPPDRCGTCTRCIEACPTGALRPYEMDASRCIAYLTIELRGTIPESLRAPMGNHVLGCDICQDVCPWNRRAPVTREPRLEPRPGLVNPELAELAKLDEAHYRERFRGSAVKRAKWSGLRRNVAVAMGNSGNGRFRSTLAAWSESEDAALREHARWALRQLDAHEHDRRD